MSRRLPAARSNYLLLTGEMVTGAEAAAWGLVTAAVEPHQLSESAARLLTRLATRSPAATAAVKQMIRNARSLQEPVALERERSLFMRHLQSADCASGIAAFCERRTPEFT